jgi:Zn-dependent protease with chaperone function
MQNFTASMLTAILANIIATIIIIAVVSSYHNGIPVYVRMKGQGHRQWRVIQGMRDNDGAAELISKIHDRAIRFLRHLRAKYHISENTDTIDREGKLHYDTVASPAYQIVNHLLRNYNPDEIYENDPRASETSYTMNKGDKMFLCLRSKTYPYKLVDEEHLMFVMLHELSHIANYAGWGHGKDFWTVFKFILAEADAAGIYTPVDYARHPFTYCGLAVEYNPMFDANLAPIV